MSDRNYWRKEAGICARDRMFGCAAFALSQQIAEHPDTATEEMHAQIAAWRELGDVAMNDSYAERAERQLVEGRRLQERRFATLSAKAAKGTLDARGQASLRELAASLDAASGSPC